MTDHLDARALSEVSELYGSLLTSGSRVLDLMASVNSHIPQGVQPVSVVGIGMNEDELATNPLLSERVLHDLNSENSLPFGDNSFDAVVCTVSVEYLVHPIEIFSEITRILKPGGIFINTFSNRWFPPKVTALWIDLHEFERVGLVSEYYLRTGDSAL
jgi:SAM-dependent methyltransferase